MKIQITKEELINAINQLDNNPKLKTGRHSSTYDLIYKNKKYPPILILSIANELKNNTDFTLSDFNNNVDIPFKFLRDNGFEIKHKKSQVKPNLLKFIEVANEQITGEGTSKSATLYSRSNKGNIDQLKIEISFGVGRASAIPWVAFTGFKQTVKDGIYPVFLYYKEFKILVLAYGVSETHLPKRNWHNSDSKTTIQKYFKNKNGIQGLVKYGSSFMYKSYSTKSLPSEKVLVKDLNNLISEYKLQFINDKEKKVIPKSIKQKDFKITDFKTKCALAGLMYSKSIITRYISSLVTKPFVLLSGLSGSGKTKLAQAFAQWICADKSQYCIVPVGADWTNREPLLGYVNALDNTEYILPENGALKLIIEANKEEIQKKPYFLILDEMNLSHVERYFADFLSVMESKDKIKLHSSENNLNITDGNKFEKSIEVPSALIWPKNLFVVGTVNIDETTYMFSPKVLDRANAIEFRVSEIEIEKFLNTPNEIDLKQLECKGANMAASFIKIAKNKDFETIDTASLNKTLVKFFAELKKTGAEFGYRTGMEIHRLYQQLSVINNDISENDKIDIAVMQKLLPKLHGSRRKLCPILETLAKLCVKEGDAKKEFLENKQTLVFKENANVMYPLSLEKITRMYKGAIDNGFASYAEA